MRSTIISIGLGALLGFLPLAGATAADMTPTEAALYEEAKKEGKLTWYVAQWSTKNSEEIAQSFAARYPGVVANVIRTTGQVAYARLLQDLRAGVAECSVFSGTDIGHYVALKADGRLMQYKPENASKLRKSYLDLDPDGYYFTSSANPTVIIYNTNQVTAADAPKNWTDLTDPKWTNKLALSHPGFSGSTGSWALLMQKLYGDDFFAKLEKLNPLIGRSLLDPPNTLNAGERAVGISSLTTATELKLKGNPIEIVYPTDGVKLTLSATGILANAPAPNAAKLFAEYLLSIENSQTFVKQGAQPLRPEVDAPAGVLTIDDMKVAPLTEEEVVAGVPGVIEKWRDVFGN